MKTEYRPKNQKVVPFSFSENKSLWTERVLEKCSSIVLNVCAGAVLNQLSIDLDVHVHVR